MYYFLAVNMILMVSSAATGSRKSSSLPLQSEGSYKMMEEMRVQVDANNTKTCYAAVKNCKGNARCKEALKNVDIKCKVSSCFSTRLCLIYLWYQATVYVCVYAGDIRQSLSNHRVKFSGVF